MDRTATAGRLARAGSPMPIVAIGFVAGFLATLLFHQPMLALLHAVGLTPGTPYATRAAAVVGVPQFLSTAFWGGVWGIALVFLVRRLRRGAPYWLGAVLFGAVFPTLVAWFVVAPLKGLPAAGGFRPSAMETGLLVNAAWGLGAAVFLTIFERLAGTKLRR